MFNEVVTRDATWRSKSIFVLGLLTFAAGFGSFGAVASLGEVARAFGHVVHGTTVAEQMGLSGSVIGLGLGVLRFASLFGLPLAILADRWGRRTTLIWYTGIGLVCTVVAAASPSYWIFVAIFALGRPMLTAAVSIAHVAGSELTNSEGRAGALALITGAYGIGAGIAALVHTALSGRNGFRFVFLMALLPLCLVLFLKNRVVEPARWHRPDHWNHAVLGHVDPAQRRRLITVLTFTFGFSLVTGPANGYLFLYADNVVKASSTTVAIMVVASSMTGLGGLLLGRWGADRFGRKPVLALAMTALVAASLLVYAGPVAALVIGYVCSVAAAGALAPPGTALSNELFPTEVRASVAGWNIAAGVLGSIAGLLAFGVLVDRTASFATAACITFIPTIAILGLLLTLPETRGKEPEELWVQPSTAA